MTFPITLLSAAHKHSFKNRPEVMASDRCGCFHCHAIFAPNEVDYWVTDDGGDTATCPSCTVDSVIGSASGLPVEDVEFLRAMHAYWFERTINA